MHITDPYADESTLRQCRREHRALLVPKAGYQPVSFYERSGKRLAAINDAICLDDSHHTCKTAVYNPKKNLAAFFDSEVNVVDNVLKFSSRTAQYYSEGHVKGATYGKISPTRSHRAH